MPKPKRTRRTIDYMLWGIALVFLVCGVWYLPICIPFLPFGNQTCPPTPMNSYTRIPIPYFLSKPEKNVTAYFTITLATNTDYVVGEPLLLTVAIEMPLSISKNLSGIYVEPEQAMKYSPTKKAPTDFSFLFLKDKGPLGIDEVWLEKQLIEYTVIGSFGFSVSLIGQPPNVVTLYEYQTKPMFSIDSQDLLFAKRNEALNTTVAFLVLSFAVLGIIRIRNDKSGDD